MSHRILCLLVIIFLSFELLAESEDVAIINAHIFSMGPAGEVKSGTVLIRDGKIIAIGKERKLPSGAHVIDAKGRMLTPGMVILNSTIGVDEIPGVEQTVNSGVTLSPFSAGLEIADSINPDSTLFPIARLTGATSAVVIPRLKVDAKTKPIAKIFSGQAAAISLGHESRLLIKANAAMVLQGGEGGFANAGGSSASFFAMIKAQLDETRAYTKNRGSYERNQMRQMSLTKKDLEALAQVVARRQPLLVEVHGVSDIRRVIKFAQEQKIRLILSGASEGWRVAGEIAAAKIPVLLNADVNLPYAFEAISSTLQNARLLNAAGVLVSIHGADLYTGGKTVRLEAGRAVSRGLPWLKGLASVTINPAQAFGISERIGSIEPGKQADLVIWSGDPLDTSGNADVVFIEGREQPLVSRQTQLRDRYLKPPNGLPMQYR